MGQFTKIAFIILLTIVICSNAKINAQEFGSNVKQEGKVTLQTEQQGFKPDVRVSIGTSFSTFGPGFNAFGTYIAPEISFPVLTSKLGVPLNLESEMESLDLHFFLPFSPDMRYT